MASCGSEDALRRAPVLGFPNRNSSSCVSNKRHISISTTIDDECHRRRRNSSPQRELIRNDTYRNNFSNNVERNINRSPLPYRRSSVSNHDRPYRRNTYSNSRWNDKYNCNTKQFARASGPSNNTRSKSNQNCSSLVPVLIDDVEYPSYHSSCRSASDKLKWYLSLSYQQQLLSLLPQSSDMRHRKSVTEMAPQIFIHPDGLVDAKIAPISRCTEHVFKMIHPKKKKASDDYDDTDNDEASVDAILNDDDFAYANRPSTVSPLEQLSKDDIKRFFVALSKNNAFDIAYRNIKDDIMYCPCSLSMQHWHEIFDLGHIISDNTTTPVSLCDSKKLTKSGFLQHLKSKSGSSFHSGIQKYINLVYGSGHSFCVDTDVKIRQRMNVCPDVSTPTSTKHHVPQNTIWQNNKVNDTSSLRKSGWGDTSPRSSSTWGQRTDEAVLGSLSLRTPPDMTLPGPGVHCKVVKDGSSSKKSGWGDTSPTSSSTWGQPSEEAVVGTLSPITPPDTTLPGPGVHCNVAKDGNSLRKSGWGDTPPIAASTWGLRTDEAVLGTLSRRIPPDTTLPGLGVHCNLVKNGVPSDQNTSDGHRSSSNKHVQDTSLKTSKRNVTTSIQWCAKGTDQTHTLERRKISAQFQERTVVQVPQKIVEAPPVQHKKNAVGNRTNSSPPSSMIHSFASNTSSSHRTRAVENMINVIYLKADAERKMQHANVKLKNLTATERNRANRSVKKFLRLGKLPEVKACVRNQVPVRKLKNESITYPNIGVPNNNDVHQLEIYDSKDGGVHWIDRDLALFSFVLIPRKLVIYRGKMKKQLAFIRACEKLQKAVPRCKRSGRRSSESSADNGEMRIFGLKVMQAKAGLSNNSTDGVDGLDLHACNTLKNNMSKAIHQLMWALDTPVLMGIHNAYHRNNAWSGIDERQMYGALAASVDLTSGSHVDTDFLVSMFNANVNMEYTTDDDICQYFNFPEAGVCVAIRPGDWLLFNPQTHHCITRNQLTYIGEPVHVSTCYLKTGHVSGNDNSVPLTELEKKYFVMDLNKK